MNKNKHPKYYYSRLVWAKSMQMCSCGCHQIAERSFFYRGYQFPVCARCTGTIIGELAAIVLLIFKCMISVPISIIMAGLMFADWLIQYVGIKESNNKRRLVTGIVGGLGSFMLYVRAIRFLIAKILKVMNK